MADPAPYQLPTFGLITRYALRVRFDRRRRPCTSTPGPRPFAFGARPPLGRAPRAASGRLLLPHLRTGAPGGPEPARIGTQEGWVRAPTGSDARSRKPRATVSVTAGVVAAGTFAVVMCTAVLISPGA